MPRTRSLAWAELKFGLIAVFAIVMAELLVFHFPVGTVIAVYAFWVLFSKEGQEYYKSRSDPTMAPNGA